MDDIALEKREKDFRASLVHRFFLRAHMGLVLTAVFLAGIIASRIMLELGLRWLVPRYILAVLASYVAFFVFLKFWLWYVLPHRAAGSGGGWSPNVFTWFGGGRGTGGGGSVEAPVRFGGGTSGGGGASDVWAASPPPVMPLSAGAEPPHFVSASSVSSGSGSGFSLPNVGGKSVVVLIVFAA